MKYSSEFKIGIVGLVTILVIIWGINYLKGINILSSTTTVYALYPRIDGLEASANVMMDGYKIGTVDKVDFEPGKEIPFTVSLDIEKKYGVKKNSIAEIFSADLLGSKAIRIIDSGQGEYHEPGDTLRSAITGDMISSLLEDLSPLLNSVESAVNTLDSVAREIQGIVSDPSVKNILNNLEGVSSTLENEMAPGGDVSNVLANLEELSASINEQSSAISSTISNLDTISNTVKNAGIDSLVSQLANTSENLASITTAIESGSGSVGKLIYEDSIYQQISVLIDNLDSLIRDVNNNPKKYVGFSVFGN